MNKYYNKIVWFLSVFVIFTNSELILLSKREDLGPKNRLNEIFTFECFAEGKDVNSTITWMNNEENLPISESNSLNKTIRTLSNTKHWEIKSSLDFDPNSPIIDERWEDFEIITTDNNKPYNITNDNFGNINYLPFSVFATSQITIEFCEGSNSCEDAILKLEESNENLEHELYLKDNHWEHLTISIINKAVVITNYRGNFNATKNLSENGVNITLIRLKSNAKSFWKIHKYTFFYSNKTLALLPLGDLEINKKEGVVVFFVLMCRGCFLGASLSNKKINFSQIEIKNTENVEGWQKVQLPFMGNFRESGVFTLSIYTDIEDSTKTENQFWAIHSIKVQDNENIRKSSITVKAKYLDYTISCRLLEDSNRNVNFSRTNGTFNCPFNKFGVNCNITLASSDNAEWHSYRICDEKHECSCSWGYWGLDCRQKCNTEIKSRNTINHWGINCTNACGFCNNNKTCDYITGKCENGCQSEYAGELCKDKLPEMKNKPVIDELKITSVKIKGDLNFVDPMNGKKKIINYKCQYRTVAKPKDWMEVNGNKNKLQNEKLQCEIKNLTAATIYEVRIILITNSNKFYDGEDVPKLQFKTDCKDLRPEQIRLDITKDSVNYSVSHGERESCPILEYNVTIFETNTNFTPTNMNSLKYCTNYTLKFFRANEHLNLTPIKILFQTNYSSPHKLQGDVIIIKANVSDVELQLPEVNSKCPQQQYIVVYKYEGNLNCHKTTKLENNLTITSNTNIIQIRNLKPYSKYSYTIKAKNKYGDGPESKKIYFNTSASVEVHHNELPSKIKIDSNKLKVTQANCENLQGEIIYYKLKYSCLSEWCVGENAITQNISSSLKKEYLETLEHDLPKELSPYSNYSVEVKIARNNRISNFSSSYTVITPPARPPKVRQFDAYSKNKTMIWLRWQTPYPPNGKLENFKIFTGSKEKVQKPENCKIWPDYKCTTVNCFGRCKIKIRAKNYQINENGEESVIDVEAKEDKPEPPQNLKHIWSNDTLELLWNHPNKTNGLLKKFQISFKVTDTKTNATSFEQEIKLNLSSSTTYQVSVKAFNIYEGKRSNQIEIITSPQRPTITKSRIYNCKNGTCEIELILKEKSDVTVNVIIPLLKECVDKIDITPFKKQIEKHIKIKENMTLCRFLNKDLNATKEIREQIELNSTINIQKTDIIVIVQSNYKNQSALTSIILQEKKTQKSTMFSIRGAIATGLTITLLLILIIVAFFIVRKKYKKNSIILNCGEFFEKKSSDENKLNIPLLVHPENKNSPSFSEEIYTAKLQKYLNDTTFSELKRQHNMIQRGQHYPCIIGNDSKNKSKNRYNNIRAYDHSRVILNTSKGENYINANYIDGFQCKNRYIATQGPKTNTMTDFWQMIAQEHVELIVMVANLVEDGKNKCAKYWPDIRCQQYFGDICIYHAHEEVTAHYTIRNFQLSYHEKPYMVKHLQFTSWPDHGVPMFRKNLLPFLKIINAAPANSHPIVVHCSGGVGRTGTIILCDIAIKMAQKQSKVDFLKILYNIRKQRQNLVDNEEQYIFAHLMVYEFLFGGDHSIPVNKAYSRRTIEDAMKMENLKNILKYLNSITWQDRLLHNYPSGDLQITDDIKLKNRDSKILPGHRKIFLPQSPPGDVGSEYINAVSVDCVNAKDKFIVTQQPMPNTLSDFWRMIENFRITLIISLNNIPDTDTTCCSFWPDESEPEMNPTSLIKVQCINVDKSNTYITCTKLKLRNRTKKQDENINVLSVKEWQPDRSVPESPSVLLTILSEIVNSPEATQTPTVVTCYDGATASGLFVSLAALIENIKEERICDVPLAIQSVRTSRPEFVRSKEQVEFLYKSALEYLETSDTYANFKE